MMLILVVLAVLVVARAVTRHAVTLTVLVVQRQRVLVEPIMAPLAETQRGRRVVRLLFTVVVVALVVLAAACSLWADKDTAATAAVD